MLKSVSSYYVVFADLDCEMQTPVLPASSPSPTNIDSITPGNPIPFNPAHHFILNPTNDVPDEKRGFRLNREEHQASRTDAQIQSDPQPQPAGYS